MEKNIFILHCNCELIVSKQTSYAFMAQISGDINSPASGHRMVYDDVITNVGGAYDKYTGTFVIPLSGTYAFSYHLTLRPGVGHWIRAYLKQNSDIIGATICNEDDDYDLCGDSSVVHANTGDDIYIVLEDVMNTNVIKAGPFETHFQGFLIRQD